MVEKKVVIASRKWWEPALREHPLFDFYDIAMFTLLGIMIGILFCEFVQNGWL